LAVKWLSHERHPLRGRAVDFHNPQIEQNVIGFPDDTIVVFDRIRENLGLNPGVP